MKAKLQEFLKKLAFLIPILVLAWFGYHFLAIFGFFLLLAFFLLGIFLPKRTICFYSLTLKEGVLCPVCKRTNQHKKFFETSLLFILAEGFILLVITCISIFLLILEATLFFDLRITSQKVSLVADSKTAVSVDEVFPVTIRVAGLQDPVNAVRVGLKYDTDKLEINLISTEKSFANIFITKVFDNEKGLARIAGGLANPGFTSSNGDFATIYFRAKSTGETKISFLPTSLILKNDGKATNLLTNTVSNEINISSQTQKDQEKSKTKEILDNLKTAEDQSNKLIFNANDKNIMAEKLALFLPSRQNLIQNIYFSVRSFDRLIIEKYLSIIAFVTSK